MPYFRNLLQHPLFLIQLLRRGSHLLDRFREEFGMSFTFCRRSTAAFQTLNDVVDIHCKLRLVFGNHVKVIDVFLWSEPVLIAAHHETSHSECLFPLHESLSGIILLPRCPRHRRRHHLAAAVAGSGELRPNGRTSIKYMSVL